MIWTINQWQFDSAKQALKSGRLIVRLEPMQAELLLYFCQNPSLIIHRDELIEKVWHGHIITENAVNKVIAKLRKSLGDNAQNASFIVTYPKKGYKFIADVKDKSPNKNSIYRKRLIRVVVSIVVVLFIGMKIAVVSFNKEGIYFNKVTALTRGGGEEYEPAISPNGLYLSYSALENNTYHLYIKNLRTGITTKISDGIGNAGGSNWSFDGKQLIYLYTFKQQCELRLMNIKKGIVISEKRIHNCPANSYGSAIFTHRKDQIIYAERMHVDQPYYLYSLNLSKSIKIKLNQPKTIKGGNSQFDLHPIENKLLISSPDHQQWLGFYQLDLDTGKLDFLFKKNQYLCCAIWNHQGDKVITMGHHPAYGLIEMSLDGKEVNSIYEAVHQVGSPVRVEFNKTYAYSGGNYDYNIDYYNHNSKQQLQTINSSVIDELPNLSMDGQLLAFLSRRSGTSQVWTKNLATGSLKQLTKFNEHEKHYDLKWSPDNKFLAVLISNGIRIVNVNSGDNKLLKLPQQEIRGMSWFDNDYIAYSLRYNNNWQVYHYNIHTSETQQTDLNWAYINYADDKKHHAYINHQEQLFINGKLIDQVTNPRWLFQNRFDFQYHKGKIYYYDHNGNNSFGLYRMDLDKKKPVHLFDSTCAGLSVSDDGLYYCDLNSKSADIFQISQ